MKAKTLSAVSAFLMAGMWICALVLRPRVFPVHLADVPGSRLVTLALAAVFLGLGLLALRGTRAAFLTLFVVYAAAALYAVYRGVLTAVESRGDYAVLGGGFLSMAMAIVVIGAFFAAVNWAALKKKG